MVPASVFRVDAASLASGIPAGGHVVNFCRNRYRFLITFYAALLRETTTLLPSSHSPGALAELVSAYAGCVVIDDAFAGAARLHDPFEGLRDPSDFIAAIGHTSGSTGVPSAHPKHWTGLQATTLLNAETIRAALGASGNDSAPWIVATVPPQHMYGLEMSVLLPLLAGFRIHCGKPLLPADVAHALAEVPEPRILVSTPIHLRALVESGVNFPQVAIVVSATAPLQQELARSAEAVLGAVLVEMFGSTETCVVATRRTALDNSWQAYPGVILEPVECGTIVSAPWLKREQLLHDVIEVQTDRTFTILGRGGDIIEVAGKRASLADLTRRLLAIPGVKDAVVFQPPEKAGMKAHRCAALVVAPGMTASQIARCFRQEVDSVFVPRPLVVVPQLPRNEVGKLPLAELITAASRLRRGT